MLTQSETAPMVQKLVLVATAPSTSAIAKPHSRTLAQIPISIALSEVVILFSIGHFPQRDAFDATPQMR